MPVSAYGALVVSGIHAFGISRYMHGVTIVAASTLLNMAPTLHALNCLETYTAIDFRIWVLYKYVNKRARTHTLHVSIVLYRPIRIRIFMYWSASE